MPFQKGNSFGSNVKRSKTFSERYRWTEEEKLAILDELNGDPLITLPARIQPISLDGVSETEPRFGVMGHYGTSFPALDKLTLGFDAGEYVILGAGTNQGKTQLATYIAKAQAELGTPTLYISRELSNTEMKARFRFIGLDDMSNLYVPDSNRLDQEGLLTLIRDFHSAHNISFVVVDHLHAFYRGADLTEALGMISAGLRELAQDLGICILALSQFNRQPYKDADGPTNYHLKESGYIADDAYTIMLAWRTAAGLNVKLSKTRRLDLGDLQSAVVTLGAAKAKLSDLPLTNKMFPL